MLFDKSEKNQSNKDRIDFVGLAKANTLIALSFSLFIILFFVLVTIFNGNFKEFFSKKDPAKENIQVKTDNIQSGMQGIFVSGNFTKPLEISNQNIQSGMQGIFVSTIYTKPLSAKASGISKGVIASSQFAKVDKAEAKTSLFASVGLLERVENTLEIDINKEVVNSPDRGIALENQLNNLKSLRESSVNNLEKITSKRQETENNYESSETASEEKQENFFQEFDQFNPGKSEELFEEFVEIKKENTEQRAQLGVLLALEERFNYLIPKIDERIRTIESNRESIILGLRCVTTGNG